MNSRLRILMSAYACEPGKGSEPEVGWQWAVQMAQVHDVTVLTRKNNRTAIERAVVALKGKQPIPTFAYFDLGQRLLSLKKRYGLTNLYYTLWQRSATKVVRSLHRSKPFDVLHHVTFAGFRYPTAIWGHGAPTVWGPIGGVENVPWGLMPWRHPQSALREGGRNILNEVQVKVLPSLERRARESTVVLASTPEMQQVLSSAGVSPPLMPTIGLHASDFPPPLRTRRQGPLELLFVGNVVGLKGLDLALQALAVSSTEARFTIIGEGSFRPRAEAMTQELGLGSRVKFLGHAPRKAVLERYPEFDVFLFPSLHDTGGFAVLEAMCNELPVICLECGGPALAVQEGCGRRIRLGPKERVIEDLAHAIRFYESNPEAMQEHGANARRNALATYSWEAKVPRMNEVYLSASTGEPALT